MEVESGGLRWHEGLAFFAIVGFVAWLFGSFGRFPFDDEVFTLDTIASHTAWQLLTDLGYDQHPPLYPLLFKFLAFLGLPLPAMRCVSLVMSATAFALVLDLTLAASDRANGNSRLATVILFATFPLLPGVGDAVRWYPLFSLLVSAFFWLALRRDSVSVGGGLLLGIAASTNFFAAIAYIAFFFLRYVHEQKFNAKDDAVFHIVLLVVALPGLAAFVALADDALRTAEAPQDLWVVPLQQGVIAFSQVALGFFGGDRVGPVDIVAGLPYILLLSVIFASALIFGSKCRLKIVSAVMITASLLFSVAFGFNRSHAFLFIAPFFLAVCAIECTRLFDNRAWLATCAASFCLLGTALANAQTSTAPYKRNRAIPFHEMLQFIYDNTSGKILYVSNENVGSYLLNQHDRCVVEKDEPIRCGVPELADFEYVVLGIGLHFDDSAENRAVFDAVRTHRVLLARGRFGYDRDADLKTKLTGVPLTPWIITVEVYR